MGFQNSNDKQWWGHTKEPLKFQVCPIFILLFKSQNGGHMNTNLNQQND